MWGPLMQQRDACARAYLDACNGQPHNHLYRAILAADSSPWIAWGEGEGPGPLEDILVVLPMDDGGLYVDMAYLDRDGRCLLSGLDFAREVHPSHWMPLPPAPAD